MSSSINELAYENIKHDLAAFTDPNTISEFEATGNTLRAEWMSRQQKHSAEFKLSQNGEVVVEFQNQEMPYPTFLASPSMADLDEIASMMAAPQSDEIYVNTRASIDDESSNEMPVDMAINTSLANPPAGSTRILFVTGEAGAGKTRSLRHLVRDQAAKYRNRTSNKLYFYVNAQGRALARLSEALATEIQDLRARSLTYHAVPALTRNFLLVPIIDGFDELLGVSGYDDAFSSLRRFLAELNGQGQIVASARSAYYEQEFLTRANVYGLAEKNIEIKPIRILPWAQEEISQFTIRAYNASDRRDISFDEFKDALNEAFESDANSKLREKPFFLARVADLVLTGENFEPTDLVEQLVSRYIERERTEKLLDRGSRPLLSSGQIRELLGEFSTEMWHQGTRALDVEDVRTLTEIYAEDQKLEPSVMRVIAERAPFMAFFTKGTGGRRVQFEHEIFFSYFLSRTVERALSGGVNSAFDCLMRGPMPEFVNDFVGEMIARDANWDRSWPVGFIETLNSVNQMRSSASVQARENSGGLLVGVAGAQRSWKNRKIEESKLEGYIFAGLSFKGVEFRAAKFLNSRFVGVDFVDAKFTDCEVDAHCHFQDILVDPDSTILEFRGLDVESQVSGLRLRKGDTYQRVFRPNLIATIIHACGIDIEDFGILYVDNDVVLLIEQLMRKFERTNMFWPDDAPNQGIVKNSRWEELRDRLLAFRILSLDEQRSVSKQPREALRRNFLPQQIMAGLSSSAEAPEEIRGFWQSWLK